MSESLDEPTMYATNNPVNKISVTYLAGGLLVVHDERDETWTLVKIEHANMNGLGITHGKVIADIRHGVAADELANSIGAGRDF